MIIIKDAGTGRIQPTDIGMIFYLTLENICPSEMYISVRGVKCCEINSLTGAKDCESMKLLGGDPGILCAGKTKNVTLIYPNLYLYGRQGVCTVLVVFKVGLVTDHFFHKIPFNTKGSFQEFSIKRCPCYTADLDPFRNCTPVDCPIKYSGHRNYFNSLTKYCEPVPYCRSVPGCSMPEEMYDILHNRCVNIRCTVTRSDLSLIEDRRIPSCPVPYILGNMICHHGCVDKKTGECICFDKWLSTVSNEPEFVPSLISSHMCNIRTGSWTELNKDKLLLTILVMVVMTSLCVLKLFFLICILHFCYKWARSRAKGEKKSMTQFGFCKGYGTTCSEACSGYSKPSTKSKSKKSSLKSRCRSKDRSERNTCVQNIFEMPPRKELCCRSQGALAKARLSDKCLQLEIAHTCPDVGVIATVACACKEQTTEHPTVKTASVQTVPSSKSNSKESLLSDESGSETSSSICSCESTDESVKKYRNDTNTYFTTTYTGFHSTTCKSKASSSGGNETTTQTISNFSINMEYDSEDLELECSSSSEK
ncbi:uncharacterized protein LOC123309773 isoform X2 [Coccinella septempunctata]|uniref:uncharacterized protein LOC123309773 isoform X2 n=1 Tax=Coccinella septempunctata TaxID=41139 RepID=UPI001D07F16D|nr:uncharacterized protein LOC123309773 isoform X2 [Coccinella septempunctata]